VCSLFVYFPYLCIPHTYPHTHKLTHLHTHIPAHTTRTHTGTPAHPHTYHTHTYPHTSTTYMYHNQLTNKPKNLQNMDSKNAYTSHVVAFSSLRAFDCVFCFSRVNAYDTHKPTHPYTHTPTHPELRYTATRCNTATHSY